MKRWNSRSHFTSVVLRKLYKKHMQCSFPHLFMRGFYNQLSVVCKLLCVFHLSSRCAVCCQMLAYSSPFPIGSVALVTRRIHLGSTGSLSQCWQTVQGGVGRCCFSKARPLWPRLERAATLSHGMDPSGGKRTEGHHTGETRSLVPLSHSAQRKIPSWTPFTRLPRASTAPFKLGQIAMPRAKYQIRNPKLQAFCKTGSSCLLVEEIKCSRCNQAKNKCIYKTEN